MDGFTLVDAGVLVIVLVSAILSYSRGLVREVFAILGWVAAGAAGLMFAKQAAPLVRQIPVLEKFLGDNCELSTIAAFFAVFAGALIIMSIITPLFAAVIQRSALSGVDQSLGFLFGVTRGVLLVAVAFLVYNRVITDQAVPMVEKSRSAQIFASLEAKLGAEVPSDAPGWLAAQYNKLVGDCGAATTVAPTGDAAPATGTATPDATTGQGTNTTGAKTVTP